MKFSRVGVREDVFDVIDVDAPPPPRSPALLHLPIFTAIDGTRIIDGVYSLNITTDSEILLPYEQMDKDSTRHLFIVAEIMQNIMDWVFSSAFDAESSTQNTSQFMDGFNRNFILQIEHDRIVITKRSTNTVLCYIKHVHGKGLVIVQNGIGMIDCLKLLTIAETTKNSKRSRTDQPSSIINAGGFGIGLKQTISVCVKQNWKFEIHGTYAGEDGKISSLIPRQESGLIVVAGARAPPSKEVQTLFASATGSGISFFPTFLMHVLDIPGVENFISIVMKTHVSLKHLNDECYYRDENYAVFKGTNESAIFINGIYSGKTANDFERSWDGEQTPLPPRPDVLVVGEMKTYTSHTRGQIDREVNERIFSGIIRTLITTRSKDDLYEMCRGDDPWAFFLRSESDENTAAELKTKIKESDAFINSLEPYRINGHLYDTHYRDSIVEFTNKGYIAPPLPFLFYEEKTKFDNWMNTQIEREDFNGMSETIYSGLFDLFTGSYSAMDSILRLTYADPTKRVIYAPNSIIGLFSQFLNDAGFPNVIFRWTIPPVSYENSTTFKDDNVVLHTGLYNEITTWDGLFNDLKNIADVNARVYHTLFYFFRNHIFQNGNVAVQAGAAAAFAQRVTQAFSFDAMNALLG